MTEPSGGRWPMRRRTLVVVGFGMVAQRLLDVLIARDATAEAGTTTGADPGGRADAPGPAAGGWEIVVLGEEPRPAYDRVALSRLFDDATPRDLELSPTGFLNRPGVTVRLGDPVTTLDRASRIVTTAGGCTFAYDALVLATGSRPFVPPIPGSDLPGCHVYRTVEDVDAIKAAAVHAAAVPSTDRPDTGSRTLNNGSGPLNGGSGSLNNGSGSLSGAYAGLNRGVDALDGASALLNGGSGGPAGAVVGGGLLGLEAAGALRGLGLRTHVLELAPRLMALQVDDAGGEMLRGRIQALGVTAHLGVSIERLEAGADGRVARVHITGRPPLDVKTVVFSAGVRPRDELARAAGLPVGERGGIVVDECGRTADPAIYAIGECACAAGRVYGLVGPGYAMAEIVADQLLGGAATFTGADTSTKLKLLGVDVASFGDAFGTTEGALPVTFADPVTGVYKKLVLSDDANRLLGGILVGDASAYGTLRALAGSDAPLPDDPARLILPAGGGDTTALPADAPVCTCHTVTRGDLETAIVEQELTDLAGVKACTRAGTGCGSCLPLVKDVLAAQLASMGVAGASRGLCEHFDHTRAELFDIVRVKGITTFSRLLAEHGRGRGCEVCRPVAASILASLSSGHILGGEQAALQDTNDHLLANLQKDGTYSVIPRLPGGEVSPDALITIGQVAKDFGLYTKITGGQRIDLLGARRDELPAIWRRLVDAGMESGHAYGKALRTVKSCVGDTWCRYGVQDSTTLAIRLELRYRGLRAPHKIKMAVSGCARECAEAQGKDVGIIATEAGWNLYVGGNGGFRPRHADLLATDLDTETLVHYVDRFLMFYIRTADRLQRTAPWLEGLDGGLDYLRRVIIDDELGLCAELDAAMSRHVASYQDEWRQALDDPTTPLRFASFVNAPDIPDPSIVRVVERGQPRPARPHEAVLVAGPRLPVRTP